MHLHLSHAFLAALDCYVLERAIAERFIFEL
jgi:hypothetical protein